MGRCSRRVPKKSTSVSHIAHTYTICSLYLLESWRHVHPQSLHEHNLKRQHMLCTLYLPPTRIHIRHNGEEEQLFEYDPPQPLIIVREDECSEACSG